MLRPVRSAHVQYHARNTELCPPQGWNADLFEPLKAAGGKAYSNYAVGYNNVDVPSATERGIAVGNTPGHTWSASQAQPDPCGRACVHSTSCLRCAESVLPCSA